MISTDEYGRRALEFVAKIAQAESRDDILALTRAELEWFGLDYLTSWSLPDEGAPSLDCVDVNTRPASYVDHYLKDNLLDRDPVIRAMRQSLTTLSWSHVKADYAPSKAERMILDEARDFGATDGLTIPVVSTSGCIGVFSPCGDKPDLSDRACAALELIGLYAHQALQRADLRERRVKSSHVPLSSREREVMRWVAVGKTNEEIGIILNIASATVKTILSRAQCKLNAPRRTYAVVRALRLGELDFNF